MAPSRNSPGTFQQALAAFATRLAPSCTFQHLPGTFLERAEPAPARSLDLARDDSRRVVLNEGKDLGGGAAPSALAGAGRLEPPQPLFEQRAVGLERDAGERSGTEPVERLAGALEGLDAAAEAGEALRVE